MDHFPYQITRGITVVKSTRPNLSHFKYAVMILGALAVAAFPPAGLTAVASAERVWDLEKYQECEDGLSEGQLNDSLNQRRFMEQKCCEYSGGIFQDDGYLGKCVAPPAEPSSGSRQLPGNIQIPSDITTAPLTKAPTRPIQVPSDIATVSAVSQAPA